MIDTKNMNLNELSTATRENLKSLDYGLRTIQMVNSIWKDLSQFLGSRSETSFQPVYGLEYLHERIGYPECLYRKLTPNERDYIRAVRMLTSFQETGTIPEALTRNRDDWSEPVKEIRDVYIRHCEEVFKTHATQRSRIAAADRFIRIVRRQQHVLHCFLRLCMKRHQFRYALFLLQIDKTLPSGSGISQAMENTWCSASRL